MTHHDANFSHAAAQAHQWVDELATDLTLTPRHALQVLKAVLHTLRDWLSHEEMADLAAQLPTLVRGIYYEGWNPGTSPAWERTKADFIENVRRQLTFEPGLGIEAAIGAVFGLIDRHVAHGEVVQVKNSMKKTLRDLWPLD